MNRSACSLMALSLAVLAGCSMSERRFVASWKNKPAPDFGLKTFDGGEVRLSSYRGQPVLLSFFAHG